MSGDPWDNVPPVQALVAEVLTARWRLGEDSWPFPARCRQALEALARNGLVTYDRGFSPRTLQARMTEAGRQAWLTATCGYEAPLQKLVEEALFLRQHGERAPGGSETWRDWDAKAELFLRGRLPGPQEGQ